MNKLAEMEEKSDCHWTSHQEHQQTFYNCKRSLQMWPQTAKLALILYYPFNKTQDYRST